MMGTVYVQDLKITCIVGIYEKERELKQNLFLDIEMDLDFGCLLYTSPSPRD